MSEITESEERLARPLIRLAKLVGVGTSYLGMSHDYHEIDDDVLIEVLAALGIDASSESAQLIAIRRILTPDWWHPPCCISPVARTGCW